jgi:microcystin-dependent protein
MALPFYSWSRTAASNATADSTVNWQEGQAPSSVNDSGRAMMASTAAFRDDISGAIATGGTSTAYTVTSYQVFDTLAHLNGQIIAFTPHTTNGATVTLNVDGLGAKPLRPSPGIELVAGVLVQGTPYVALYNNSDAVFYLQNSYVNPYNIPLCGGIDYWGTTAPNSSFVFAFGQAISRTTYSAAFALMGTAFGTGDGSTTFNLPDKRGRTSAGVDSMGGSSASRLTATGGMNGTGIGSVGGTQTQTLTIAQLPVVTPAGTIASTLTLNSNANITVVQSAGGSSPFSGSAGAGYSVSPVTGSVSSIFTGTPFGSGTAHTIVQPTITCNYIIRILTVLLTLHASIDIFVGWIL